MTKTKEIKEIKELKRMIEEANIPYMSLIYNEYIEKNNLYEATIIVKSQVRFIESELKKNPRDWMKKEIIIWRNLLDSLAEITLLTKE